jgi:hypothetical protein
MTWLQSSVMQIAILGGLDAKGLVTSAYRGSLLPLLDTIKHFDGAF